MRLSYNHLLLIGLVATAGCQFGSSAPGSGYPTTPPVVKAAATVPTTEAVTTTAMLKVPADARVLSSGAYPPPGFSVPNEPGTIEVVDMDGDPTVAVASTSVTGTEANKNMSITDVPNMAGILNKTHSYKIVFVPLKSAP